MFVWNGTIWGRCPQLIGRRSHALIFYIKSKEKYLELRKKNLTVFLFLFLFLHKVQ
jgi:hypothetical protein